MSLISTTDAAVALSGEFIAGRAVRVDFASDRPPREGGGFGRGGGRGGFGDRGGRGGRGGDRGGRGRGAPRGMSKNGGIAAFQGKKITF